jgi:hypothetical protein
VAEGRRSEVSDDTRPQLSTRYRTELLLAMLIPTAGFAWLLWLIRARHGSIGIGIGLWVAVVPMLIVGWVVTIRERFKR